ncbi:MAG: serine hydrolase domain-containing protein [Parvularcula sp.]|jgi:CubicO group peptidase (beta-lactamase class C family)|nr:serine hydrolase domain-containing protein [Parvularcula sp.]
MRTLLVAVALFTAPATASEGPPFREDFDPDEALGLMREYEVPGLAYARIEDCRDSDTAYLGVRDKETGRPVDRKTVFELASPTKSVFSVMVMTLAEEGIVDLDRPLALDRDEPRIKEQEDYRVLTPRMVLSHRTGLPNWADDVDNKAVLDAPLPFLSPPGESFTYSGEAYGLLQHTVEAIIDAPTETLFERTLAEIMPHSSFEKVKPGTHAATGYFEIQGKEVSLPAEETPAVRVAGGLLTTAEDVAAFVGMICQREGLSEESYDTLFENYSPREISAEDRAEGVLSRGYGLGFALEETVRGSLIYHNGNNGNFQTLYLLDPDRRTGVVYLTNSQNGLSVIDRLISLPAAED